jgi:hypothetical protein
MRRYLLILGLGVVLSVAAPGAAAAQSAPADTAAVLVDLARQFEAEGRRELATTLLAVVAERYPGTLAASEALARLAVLRASRPDRSGRTELMVSSTLYGLWLGAAVPAAFGANEPAPYGIGLLLGGPAGFLLAREAVSAWPLSEGQARAITFGGLWGTWQGAGWRYVLEIGAGPDPESSTRAAFGAMVVGGLGGIGTGALLASRGPISADRMTVVNFGALWGTWYGLAAGLLGKAEGRGLMASALVGGDLGLVVSALMAPQWELSRSRARLISVAGVAGGVAGLGVDLLVKPDDERVAILIPALTSVAGLVAGTIWTRGHDDKRQDAGGRKEDGALLEVGRGRARLNWSLPEPALLPADRAGERQVLGARLNLLWATF